MNSTTRSADVIVVGGGHNGLICAAYLARAGINTLLVEARDEVGGCASTVSDLGARFNICNCDHTMVRAMPIIDELELESYGLHYLEADASIVNFFYDGAEPWPFFFESERVLDALSASYPDQVAGYRRYLADAMPVVELVVEMARTKPSTARMVASALRRRGSGAARMLDWSRRSADDVFAQYFDDWHIPMPAISTGPTVWGVSGSTPGTGLAATSYALRHLVKTGRPRGGSGELTEATRASFEAAGGQVQCSSYVERLLVRDGHVHGVRLTDGTELQAPAVVAACDPQRVFVDWIDEAPAAARRMVERWRAQPVSDGYESKVDGVMSTLPRYRAIDALESQNPNTDFMESTMVVSPSPEQLREAHAGRLDGRVAEYPTLLSNTPSVLDPSMRTAAGDHVLSLEVLYTPLRAQGRMAGVAGTTTLDRSMGRVGGTWGGREHFGVEGHDARPLRTRIFDAPRPYPLLRWVAIGRAPRPQPRTDALPITDRRPVPLRCRHLPRRGGLRCGRSQRRRCCSNATSKARSVPGSDHFAIRPALCSTVGPETHDTALVNTALVNTALVNTALVNTALVNTALVNIAIVGEPDARVAHFRHR